MSVAFQGRNLIIDGKTIEMPHSIIDAAEVGERIYVLFDPNAFIKDPKYKDIFAPGAPSIRNLVAVTKEGSILWEAEFPQPSDYYYNFSSVEPLLVNSFSSYRCEIDPSDGKIVRKVFFK